MTNAYVADFSLALINRTGAYYICRDLIRGLLDLFPRIRYWRFFRKHEPVGITRKVLGWAMLMELRRLAQEDRLTPEDVARCCSRATALPTVYLDPLYVLRNELRPDDIVLCHDVGPITHPHLYDHDSVTLYKLAYRKIQVERPGMVFVSETSRREFSHLYGSDYPFMDVIPLYARNTTGAGPDHQPAGIEPPFLLTVAAIERRKNLDRCVAAFIRSGLFREGFSYVLCGPRGYAAEEILNLAETTPGIQVLGYVPDEELRWLYRNASGFVLPSLLEGIGLTALEAGAHGLIPLVSADSAQTEAVGEGALGVDPLSVSSIAEGMVKLVRMDNEEREHRLQLIRRRVGMLTLNRFLMRWRSLLAGKQEIAA